MIHQKQNSSTRALVLGGGGVTGIAWEVGVLTGVVEAGVALYKADTIIGTSAGSFVGAALASSDNLKKLFAAQFEPNDFEIPATVSERLAAAWYNAFVIGGSDPQRVGAAFGAIAKEHPALVSVAQSRSAVEARLVTREWPQTLRVTARDADTGQLHVFDRTSGIALIDAVSASGAVPGISPRVSINGRAWIDAGMVSSTNAHLADDYARVVILAPLPTGYGLIPGVAEDVAAMSASATVFLVTPDAQSGAEIGPELGSNIYDPTRRSAVALAGQAQGRSIAAAIQTMW